VWNIEKVVKKGDYDYGKCKEHPKATKNGYVLLHRLIVENNLNRLLNDEEEVHHINHNRKDNRIENLQVMTKQEHSNLHSLEKSRECCDLKCPWCGVIFTRWRNKTLLVRKKNKFTCCSPSCRGKLSRKIQLFGITTEVENAISGNIVREYRVNFNSLDNPEETETTGSVETIRIPPEMAKR
jgi:hypothetical protein